MVEIKLPNKEKICRKYLVSDFTETPLVDGVLGPGVKEKLNEIAKFLEIHILTGDTFLKKAKYALEVVHAKLCALNPYDKDMQKEKNKIKKLGK